MSTVYVVIRKPNHYGSFASQNVLSPVLTWNSGVDPIIEGVFAHYPTQFAHSSNFQICGPYVVQGGFFDRSPEFRGRVTPHPPLNYPNLFKIREY